MVSNEIFQDTVFQCVSATNCTSDTEHYYDKDLCQPPALKDYKVHAVVNIIVIICIGGLGNLFTILAILSARIR